MIEPDRAHFQLPGDSGTCTNPPTDGVVLLGDRQTIASLEEQWRSLYAKAGSPYSVFQSYEWCAAWLDANPQADVRVAARFENGSLTALLPLMLHRMAGIRVATEMGGLLAEYVVVLCDGVEPGEFVRQVENLLHDEGSTDVLSLDGLVDCAGLGADHCRESDGGPSFICDVSGFEDYQSYLGNRSPNTRSNIKRNWKKLRQQGEVTVEAGMPTQQRLAEVYPALAKWKRDWLFDNGIAGAAYDDEVLGAIFYRLAGSPDSRASLCATIISVDGQPVNANIYIADSDTLHCIGVYRDTNVRHVSLGVLMQDATVSHALDNGFSRIDFGPGENEDKKRNATLVLPRYVYHRELTTRGSLARQVGLTGLRQVVKSGFYLLPLSARKHLLKLRG